MKALPSGRIWASHGLQEEGGSRTAGHDLEAMGIVATTLCSGMSVTSMLYAPGASRRSEEQVLSELDGLAGVFAQVKIEDEEGKAVGAARCTVAIVDLEG